MLNEAQLKARSKGIGGSDAAVVAGISPWKQPLQLFYEKTGQIEFDGPSGEHIDFGNLLEDVIAREAGRRMGVKVRRVNLLLQHSEHDFMIGYIDRDIVGKPWFLECKNVGFKSPEWGADGSDEIPESYLIQCQHYMAIAEADLCKLAALFSGNHMRVYNIPRDQGLIDSLIEIEHQFWQGVLTGVPPSIYYDHPTTPDLLTKLYPGTTGEVIELPESALHWSQVEREAAALESEYRKAREIAQNHLKSMMAEAAIALLPDGTGYTRKEVKKKGFVAEPTRYINFRFSKSPKGANK